LAALFEIQSDAESNAMAGTKPRTREVFFATWDKIFIDPKVNGLLIEIDEGRGFELVGSIACFQAEGLNCVGYWIAKSRWGQGIASRALAMFLKEETRRPLHATTAGKNAVSRHILEKYGFRCVGTRMGEETERYLAREIADFVLE
jgi:RimJ/RimL family protein N-acetyltransferase